MYIKLHGSFSSKDALLFLESSSPLGVHGSTLDNGLDVGGR